MGGNPSHSLGAVAPPPPTVDGVGWEVTRSYGELNMKAPLRNVPSLCLWRKSLVFCEDEIIYLK